MIYRKNIYNWEQILRVTVGVIVAAYALVAMRGSWLGYGLIATGATLVVTGLLGWCPMCAIGSRRLKSRQRAGS